MDGIKGNFVVFVFSFQERLSNITKPLKSMQGHSQDKNNLHSNQLNCYKQINLTNKPLCVLINEKNVFWLKLFYFISLYYLYIFIIFIISIYYIYTCLPFNFALEIK